MKNRRAKVLSLAVGMLVLAGLFGALLSIPASRAIVRRGWLVLTRSLVDVGDCRLRVECRGSGSPTVVLDSGLTFTRASWDLVAPAVSQFTRVCSYDRAGLGDSDPGPTPRTAQQNAQDMHTMLGNAGIEGPFVLVGHSTGGLNIRLFASMFPSETAGMVLVDASHEDQYERFAALMSPEERDNYLQTVAGKNAEHVDLLTSALQVRSADRLPAMPLVVLSAQPNQSQDPRAPVSAELQADLAKLEPNCTHIVVPNSGHFIQAEQPQVVVAAIRQVVDQVRQESPILSQRGQISVDSFMIPLLAAIFILIIVVVMVFRKHPMQYFRIQRARREDR